MKRAKKSHAKGSGTVVRTADLHEAFRHYRSRLMIGGLVIILLITAMVPLLLLHAATTYTSIEPEDGSPSANITAVTDSTAADGKAVQFSPASGGCTSSATRICYLGQQWMMNGINMPWVSYGADFGGNAGGGGVLATKSQIATRLAQVKDSGMHVVRWWMFESDTNTAPWQITTDSSGAPTGINPAVYADIDAALDLANTYDIYYEFTLFNAANSFPASWRTNATQRQQLATVLGQLFARYKDNPRVMSWEIFNEPEWQINGSDVKSDDVVNMAKAVITSIRTNAPKALTTVGQALITNIPTWTGVDLDYYSPHWYDIHNGSDENALTNTAAQIQARYHTTKPIVLGEYSQLQNVSAQQNVDRQNLFYNEGYAGMWGWSLFFDKTGDQLKVDLNAVKTFDSQHGDIGPHS